MPRKGTWGFNPQPCPFHYFVQYHKWKKHRSPYWQRNPEVNARHLFQAVNMFNPFTFNAIQTRATFQPPPPGLKEQLRAAQSTTCNFSKTFFDIRPMAQNWDLRPRGQHVYMIFPLYKAPWPDIFFVCQLSAIQEVLLLFGLSSGSFIRESSSITKKKGKNRNKRCCPAAMPRTPTIRYVEQRSPQTCTHQKYILLLQPWVQLDRVESQATCKTLKSLSHLFQLFAPNDLSFCAICRFETIFEFEPYHYSLVKKIGSDLWLQPNWIELQRSLPYFSLSPNRGQPYWKL